DVGVVSPSVKVISGFPTSAVATVPVDVRLAPPPGQLGVTINHAALGTTDPNVTISAVWPIYTTTITISNDGGVENPTSFPAAPDGPGVPVAARARRPGPPAQDRLRALRRGDRDPRALPGRHRPGPATADPERRALDRRRRRHHRDEPGRQP